MDSFYWQIISDIFLGIGLILLFTALFLTIRYRVISNLISDLRVGKMAPEPVITPSSITIDLRNAEAGLNGDASSEEEEGPWTVVVAPKQEESGDGTVVVGKSKDGAKSEFNITSSILVINADVDVIDSGRKR